MYEKKYYTHDGKTLGITEWAKELNVNPKTMSNRLIRFSKGELSEEKAFAVCNENHSIRRTKKEEAEAMNKRHRCVDTLFDSFIKHGLPKIDSEMKFYMETGEIGPALNFFIKYQKYFSAEAYDLQAKNSVQQLAQFANIYIQKQEVPKNITLIG